jgi:hypothetical protein
MRRLVVAAAILGLLALGFTAGAGALPVPGTGKIGPDQYFRGLVNGSTGQPYPAIIRMACFGPIRPGQLGHPFAGQTVEVQQVPLTAGANGDLGFTGPHGTQIGAFFGPLPPSSQGGSPVLFQYYGVPEPIPTSELLPCGGPGTVAFVPLPFLRGGRIADVPVEFVGQP